MSERTHELDAAGNLLKESGGVAAKTFTYSGNHLQTMTVGALTSQYHYDSEGNLDCITAATGSPADCSPSNNAGRTGVSAFPRRCFDPRTRLSEPNPVPLPRPRLRSARSASHRCSDA